jgi:hypothetical protein
MLLLGNFGRKPMFIKLNPRFRFFTLSAGQSTIINSIAIRPTSIHQLFHCRTSTAEKTGFCQKSCIYTDSTTNLLEDDIFNKESRNSGRNIFKSSHKQK